MAQRCRALARECHPRLNLCRSVESIASLAVVIDHAEGETNSAFQPTHAVAQANPIESAAAFYWTVSRRENENLSSLGGDDFGSRLGTRLLFDDHEFSALIVGAGLAQNAGQLQRKRNRSVYVLMETVEIAAFIVQK